MDQFGSQMRSAANNQDAGSGRAQSQPRPANSSKASTDATPKQHSHSSCAEVKPRLTKEQHDILEAHFQQHHKPSTSTKKGFAETLGVPVDKINNWFQNRRAKVKQDLKKQMNQYNMGMNMYGAAQIPLVTSQFPPHSEQPQPQPAPITQDFYSVNADISPTCLPVESVEGPSALELGSQISLHQPFDMHTTLRSIPEAERSTSYHPNAVMQSFMAAAAGAPYLQSNQTSLPQQESGFSYDTSGLSQPFSSDLAFSVPATLPNGTAPSNDVLNGFADLSGFDYSSLTVATTAAPAPPHDSAGSISSEQSPFSGAQSTATTQSSGGPNASSVTSIASVYSNWTDDQNSGPEITPAHQSEDPFDHHPYSLPQASASEQALGFWGANGQSHPFSHSNMYQHSNASAHAILTSPGQTESRKLSAGHSDFETPPAFADDAFARRNSSTSNLANTIESIHIQNAQTPDGFKQPDQPTSIASRRHKRPAALNPSTFRSASYTSGMPSPGANPTDHTLRRIRSSGIGNNAAGRIQKPNPGSAQRSPMNLTFAEAAQSPKFARTFSSTSTGQGGSLAPPTPLTPNEMGRFPYWQSSTVIRSQPPMPEHSSPESLNVSWSVEQESAGLYSTNKQSPPSTPLDLGQINQVRLAGESLYRDTPPQSAPATQQSFPPTAFMPPPQMNYGFRSTSDLTIMQPKPSHFRRPSLPDAGHAHLDDAHMQFPVQLSQMGDLQIQYDPHFKSGSLNGITHNVPFAPSVTLPEFFVHEYSPPQGSGEASLRRPAEPQPKNYIFANQGPGDFRS